MLYSKVFFKSTESLDNNCESVALDNRHYNVANIDSFRPLQLKYLSYKLFFRKKILSDSKK